MGEVECDVAFIEAERAHFGAAGLGRFAFELEGDRDLGQGGLAQGHDFGNRFADVVGIRIIEDDDVFRATLQRHLVFHVLHEIVHRARGRIEGETELRGEVDGFVGAARGATAE